MRHRIARILRRYAAATIRLDIGDSAPTQKQLDRLARIRRTAVRKWGRERKAMNHRARGAQTRALTRTPTP